MAEVKIFPFEIKAIDEKFLTKYPEFKDDYVFVGPKNYCLPNAFKDAATTLYNFEPRPNDVWLFGFPRSGTTLTQEIVWLLSNNLNFEKASESVMDVRFPVLEGAIYLGDDHKRISDNLDSYGDNAQKIAEKWTRPAWETLSETQEKRFIKTHLPLSLMSPKILTSGCKVIYVARNPKDVCVSNFLIFNSFNSAHTAKTFDKFWEYSHQGFSLWTPFFEHVEEGWELRNNKNFLFLQYEKCVKDMRQTLRNIAEFLGKEVSDGDVDKLAEHVKIDNFRKNKSVNNDHLKEIEVIKNEENNFIRKGVVGGWKDYFSPQINAEADKWIGDNLQKTSLEFS